MAGTPVDREQLAERARTYRNERRAHIPQLVSTQVTVDNNASASATVVEVRAEDVVGQLHRITRALVECHCDVTSAKVSTFGSAVVDAFYVRGPDGHEADRSASRSPLSRRPSRERDRPGTRRADREPVRIAALLPASGRNRNTRPGW